MDRSPPLVVAALLLTSGAGCASPPRGPLLAAGPAAAVFPRHAPAPGRAWYENRLDGGIGVPAGREGVRVSTSVTRTRGGLRVGADGRVRDTLEVRTRTRSVGTATR